MRKLGGWMRENVDLWLEDFTFRNRFLKDYNAADFSFIYIETN